MKKQFYLITLCFLSILNTLNSQVVSTFVGTIGGPGSTDGSGFNARFNNPNGVCADGSGNIYVADYQNNKIRKVTPTGVVTTFAGSNVSGSTDATGVLASFNNPSSVCLDPSGNIYVADYSNHKIRKITSAGIVTTFAGSGTIGSTNGLGTAASFNYPKGLCADASGNIYVADEINNLIRKITPTGLVTTVAGDGLTGSLDGTGIAARFYNPSSVCSDGAGNIYVADTYNNKIRKITSAGVVSTFAGSGSSGLIDGTGIAASFYYPEGICFDVSTNILYVADSNASRIRKITASAVVTTLAGGAADGYSDGTGSLAGFYESHGICTDLLGNIYVADFGNSLIRKVTPAGLVTTLAGFPAVTGTTDGIGYAALLNQPSGICYDPSGNLYVAESPNHTIRKITPSRSVTTFAGTGSIGSTNATGTSASFNQPTGVCSDATGNIYIADSYNHMIRKITPAGVVTTFAGSAGSSGSVDGTGTIARFKYPLNLCSDASNNIYVADFGNNSIRKITPAGVVTTIAGSTSGISGSTDATGTAARFYNPSGVSIDAAGTIYVADYNNNKIRKINSLGVVTTLAGSGLAGSLDATGSAASFNKPRGVCLDASGNIYIADYSNHKVRTITPSGVVTTFAGSGARTTDDGVGIAASFGYPSGICRTASGDFYVTDSDFSKIRKITSCTTPSAPTNTTTLPNTQACVGNTTTLTATGTGTISWFTNSTGGTSIASGSTIVTSNTLTVGTYTYYAEDYTCTNSASRTSVTFTVNPTPTITVNSGTICAGSSFTMSPSGASTYTYSSGSNIVTPTTTTNYTVTGTSASGCTNTAISNLVVTTSVTPSILISTLNTTICGTSAAFTSTITNGGTSPVYQWKKNGANVGSGLTSYSPTSLVNGDVLSCILTSNATCATPTAVVSNSITMTVGTTPTITVNSGSICTGSSFTISPSGASTFTYSSGSAIVSPTTNTNYTVTGTTALGCTNTAVSSISVNALPLVSATTSNSLICTGTTVTLTATGATSYTWNTGSNLTSYPVTPTTTTSYTLIGTDANGCKNNTIITQSVSLCTGLNKIGNEITASIFPNPSNGLFTIRIEKDARILILNQLGEIILEQLITSGENTVNIENLANGFYFVKISQQNSLSSFKIIKN